MAKKLRTVFVPSGRSALVPEGTTILEAAIAAGEPLVAECGGRGACGLCLVRILRGEVPAAYRQAGNEGDPATALACLAPVLDDLEVAPLTPAELPRLESRGERLGLRPLADLSPPGGKPLALDPAVAASGEGDLGVALDIGTTTLRLLLVRLGDGVVVGEAGGYNPQIPMGADVISRIVAAERGQLGALARAVRSAVRDLLTEAAAPSAVGAEGLEAHVRAYSVAGNVTMIHLLLGEDPAGIRRVPSTPRSLAFPPVEAASLGWPGGAAPVSTLPAAGGWVGGDIVAGVARAGLPVRDGAPALYVDLGTNGEIALGARDFALACACSAGPAFEGGGIRSGMRADSGAVDGARVDAAGELVLSVKGGGPPRGICGSGLITLADALFRAGYIDRAARLTARLPRAYLHEGPAGLGVSLPPASSGIVLLERDLASLVRAKAAIFAGIRSLLGVLGLSARDLGGVLVSGNFGRYLNLGAAHGIGLLPHLPADRHHTLDNGALDGAALALLSRRFRAALEEYLARITYVDLSELPTYMDEFVAASFLPHTDPSLLG
jgi:uncharacterized 2Fe-2S/4Fe-4S cluster protein (DUF4445 family)